MCKYETIKRLHKKPINLLGKVLRIKSICWLFQNIQSGNLFFWVKNDFKTKKSWFLIANQLRLKKISFCWLSKVFSDGYLLWFQYYPHSSDRQCQNHFRIKPGRVCVYVMPSPLHSWWILTAWYNPNKRRNHWSWIALKTFFVTGMTVRKWY